MSKIKGDALYQKLKASREQLVKKYTAGGSIAYDTAVGIRGELATAAAVTSGISGVAGTTIVNGVTLTTIVFKGVTYIVTKSQKVFQPDAELGALPTETLTVPDFDQIKLYNIARGVASGSMMDALAKFASGKVLTISGNSASLGVGGYVIGEVPCLVQITANIKSIHGTIVPARPTGNDGIVWGGGNAVAGTRLSVERAIMEYRGKFKIVNYRGTPEMLTHPTSIWATTDLSRQSMFQFGVNSLIRMWGVDQVLDLNSFKIEMHERPNRFAAFSVLIDLADGHFRGLSSKGAKNAHIYCSKGTGILGRNNHFGIRGHLVDGLLVENVISGAEGTISGGSYFGTAMLNQSSNIVIKDVQQKMVNRAVSLSSAGLSFYAQLNNQEILFGYFETVSTWNSLLGPSPKSSFYPWLKWENLILGEVDTFGNGKRTPYPVVKTEAELATALGANAAQAPRLHAALKAAEAAYAKSHKIADDIYIQVHTASSRNNTSTAGIEPSAIPHTTVGTAVNPSNSDGFRYPDSVGYAFRVGQSAEGVGPLADAAYIDEAGLPRNERLVKNIHVHDSSFKNMHLSPMEAISLGVPGKGLTKTFNGMALRPFGYSNSLSDAAGIAGALLLMSKEAMEEAVSALRAEDKPVDFFDTAALAAALSSGWTAKQCHGLYKGNEISEASLACIEAIALLRKFFPASLPLLSGVDNSAVDIGILALRRSMMLALDAKTATQVGLKGGFGGSIKGTDAALAGAGSIEIYPWLVSNDGLTNIDKDFELGAFAKVTSISRLAGVATVTTAVPHGKLVGDVISVGISSATRTPALAAASVDGLSAFKVVVTEVLSDTVLKYAQAGVDVASGVATGTLGFPQLHDRRESTGYTAAILPQRSASIFRLKLVDHDTMALVKCDDLDTPVTYQMCADMLGFTAASMSAPVDMNAPVIYKAARNLDGQNHVHKGAFGVRVDEAQDVSVSNVLIEDYETIEAGKPTTALGSYDTQMAFGLSDDAEPESGVLKIRGVSINSCEDVEIEKITIKDCHSGSRIVGVEVRGQSESVDLEEIHAENIEGHEKATALKVAHDTKKVKAKKISGSGLVAEHAGLAAVVEIESADTKLN